MTNDTTTTNSSNDSSSQMAAQTGNRYRQYPQARYWIGTIPRDSWDPNTWESTGASYIRGQLERGASGYEHWQLVAYYSRQKRLSTLKRVWPTGSHWEPTRSDAALQYVWKDDTRIGEVLINL